MGGHKGKQSTYHQIASTFYLIDLRKVVHNFVNCCHVCQMVKPFNHAPQGILQPLPIPDKVWNLVSIGFITHLPPLACKMVILVVVN